MNRKTKTVPVKHNLPLRIPKNLYGKIKKESEHKGISVHELIVIYLQKHFEN